MKWILFSRVWGWVGGCEKKLQCVCQFSLGQIEKTGLGWWWVLRMNHQPTREGSQSGGFIKFSKSEKNYKLKPSSSTSSSCSCCCCHHINNIIIAITIQTVTIIINPITKWINNIFLIILIILTRPKPAYGRQGLDWIVRPGRYSRGAPTDLLWLKKRHVTHGGPQLTSFD